MVNIIITSVSTTCTGHVSRFIRHSKYRYNLLLPHTHITIFPNAETNNILTLKQFMIVWKFILHTFTCSWPGSFVLLSNANGWSNTAAAATLIAGIHGFLLSHLGVETLPQAMLSKYTMMGRASAEGCAVRRYADGATQSSFGYTQAQSAHHQLYSRLGGSSFGSNLIELPHGQAAIAAMLAETVGHTCACAIFKRNRGDSHAWHMLQRIRRMLNSDCGM